MRLFLKDFRLFLVPALLLSAGCGSGLGTASSSNAALFITPGIGQIDTNCTGCNATLASGGSVMQFAATQAGGRSAEVAWSVAGGDAASGPGSINARGQYIPPGNLTADRVEVMVTATLAANPSISAHAVLAVTPGFLQPLTPENVALGANGIVTITGILAEAGGSSEINYELANSPTGQNLAEAGTQGWLGATSCRHQGKTFTTCAVTFTAPSSVQATGSTYVIARVSGSSGISASRASAVVLLNTAGVTSNPASHQGQLATVALGSSGGNNADYDTRGGQIVDCCSGTLGALVEDANKRQYLLSNNHVLARSDHASVGDAIVQPGLIDNKCMPLGEGSGVQPVASLSGWLPLSSTETNVDAAIAQVTSRTVDPSGSILELGGRQNDDTLAAAPPGISSTGGRGESASLAMRVAKSGRTTGLTCGGVSAIDLDIKVDYFLDCAETRPYLTKTFTHQMGLSGNQFSDAGDSGALVVDAANAEPVGLYFAGGRDVSGVSQGVANPATEVLSELDRLMGESYRYAGTADHAVGCLSYGDSTISSAQSRALSNAENARGQQAQAKARMLLNPAAGISGVALGKSSDHLGEAAVILYTDESKAASVPATVDGVRTIAIPSTAGADTTGATPLSSFEARPAALSSTVLAQAEAIKNQIADRLLRQNPSYFGVGVGQSLDNPREAALVIYVDRNHIPAQLPATVNGLRTRYMVMERMHVTRSYAPHETWPRHCTARPSVEVR